MGKLCLSRLATKEITTGLFVQMVPYKIVRAGNGDAWVEVSLAGQFIAVTDSVSLVKTKEQ